MFALSWSTISAQTLSLTGTVLDGESGDALIGATVLAEGTTQGASAGVDGTFTLKVERLPINLTFSFIGYESQTLNVTSGAPMTVTLNMDAELVGEVVVVGY